MEQLLGAWNPASSPPTEQVSNVTVAAPRLCHQDVVMAEKLDSGSFRRLLDKVHTTSTRLSRGTACSRCKEKKSKCDGQRPCKTCTRLGLPCDAAAHGAVPCVTEFFGVKTQPSAEVAMAVLKSQRPLKVDWPVPSPSQYLFPMLETEGRRAALPLECLPMCFFSFGIRERDMLEMVSVMPPELRLALRKLGNRLQLLWQPFTPPPWIPDLPPKVEMWSSRTTCRTVQRFDTEAKTTAFECNDQFARFQGVHPEEIAARVAREELPLMFSQWRYLGIQLHFLLCITQQFTQVLCGSLPPLKILFPVAPCQALRERDPTAIAPNAFHRVTVQPYRNGFTTTAVTVDGDEYDRAVRQCPEIKGVFMDCSRGGAELLGANLMEEERLTAMAATPHGQRSMRRMAQKINDLFHLQDPVVNFFENIFIPLPESTSPPLTGNTDTASSSPFDLHRLSLNQDEPAERGSKDRGGRKGESSSPLPDLRYPLSRSPAASSSSPDLRYPPSSFPAASVSSPWPSLLPEWVPAPPPSS